VVASRSPERFGFLPELPTSPLVVALDARGRIRESRGRLVVPEHSLLTTLANAGYAALAGDTVFFAPLSRPGVVALGPRGDTLWLSAPAESLPTPEPRFRLVGGRVQIDYQPLNLALTLGPDGRLYVLRAADSAVTRARLDVIERASGQVVWRAELPNVRPTLAVNRLGRLYALDPDRLVGVIPSGHREPLAAFSLPRLGGGSLSLEDLAGRVVLINVWASWCGPCRIEMPALDSLLRSLDGPGFALVAISEDERRKDAERFVAELGLRLPVLFGDGRLQHQVHYPGLPYTLLLDGRGRIVRRWIGQLAPSDLELIRMQVYQELAASARDSGEHGSRHHHQHP
jgi:thiol-disulfide isomerase/thioredoxin